MLALVGSRGCVLCLLIFGILYLLKSFHLFLSIKILITAGGTGWDLFNAFYYDILSWLSGIDGEDDSMFLSGDKLPLILTATGMRFILAAGAVKNNAFFWDTVHSGIGLSRPITIGDIAIISSWN